MAEFLFITPQELKSTTILGGNVDQDKFLFSIANVQIITIQRLLGTELYDVILSGAEADTLTGLYLELYDKFVKPIRIDYSFLRSPHLPIRSLARSLYSC